MDLVARFEVYLVALDPTRGLGDPENPSLCRRLADELNAWLRTGVVAPMTTTIRNYLSRVNPSFARNKGQVALDQIRTIDRSRLVRKLGRLHLEPTRALLACECTARLRRPALVEWQSDRCITT